MQTKAETDDLHAERELLNTRLSALEADIAVVGSRERSLQAQLARNNDELLTLLNDLVALGNLLRNEEQKCKKLAADCRVAMKGIQEREHKLKKSHDELASLRKRLKIEAQDQLDIRAEKQRADEKLIALRVRYEAVSRESVGYERQLELSKERLALTQSNACTSSKIWAEMRKRKIAFPASVKQSKLFATLPGSSTQRWQKFCRSLAQEGIFDAQSYLALHPDVAASGVDPLVHFLTQGLAERRALKTDADL